MDLTKQRDGVVKTAIRQIDEENLRITHSVNSKAFDRYDSVVLPKGADVKHFLNNPVVLWSHNGDSATAKIPIGRCIDLDIREDEIVVTTEFNKNDALAVKVFNAYKDGFLNAWSIGFIPTKYKQMDSENISDINAKYGLNISQEQLDNAHWGAYLIYEWELLEYSAVPVPGNPEALSADGVNGYKRELVSRGLLDADFAKDFSLKSFIEKEEPAVESIEKPVAEVTPEARAEEAPVEDTVPAEEAPVAEAVAEPEAVAEEAVADEVEVEAPVAEVEAVEQEEVSNDPTEDVVEEAESVAEEIEVTEEEGITLAENIALKKAVDELTQKNQELSERVAKMDEKIDALSKINDTLDSIQKSLAVDNIEMVREAVLQKKKDSNPDSFFSNFLKSGA